LWGHANELLDSFAHTLQLRDTISGGERSKNRFVEPATNNLDLAALDECAHTRQELWMGCGEPLKEGSGVVQRESNLRVALQRLDHR